MAAPTLVKNPLQVKTGPGLILWGDIGVTIPTFVAAGSKFTNAWTGWYPLGYTDEGLTVTFGKEQEDVEVAEEYYPIRKVGTKASVQLAFSASGINEGTLSLAVSGGSWSTVSGTGATLVRKFSPPNPSNSTRKVWGFLGNDVDEAMIVYQGYQSGEITRNFRKGAEKASLSGFSIEGEVPDPLVSADVWNHWTAGAAYGLPTAYA